jgi:hypothetical protein
VAGVQGDHRESLADATLDVTIGDIDLDDREGTPQVCCSPYSTRLAPVRELSGFAGSFPQAAASWNGLTLGDTVYVRVSAAHAVFLRAVTRLDSMAPCMLHRPYSSKICMC